MITNSIDLKKSHKNLLLDFCDFWKSILWAETIDVMCILVAKVSASERLWGTEMKHEDTITCIVAGTEDLGMERKG